MASSEKPKLCEGTTVEENCKVEWKGVREKNIKSSAQTGINSFQLYEQCQYHQKVYDFLSKFGAGLMIIKFKPTSVHYLIARSSKKIFSVNRKQVKMFAQVIRVVWRGTLK